MVHVRFPQNDKIEIWLGESKLYSNGATAMIDAISSVKAHIDAGFLSTQKVLLGPQIPKSTPRYTEIVSIFKTQTSLDALLNSAVFAIGILCDSASAKAAHAHNDDYRLAVRNELAGLSARLKQSELHSTLKLVLIYIPLAGKKLLVQAFDDRLKGLQ